MNRSLVETGSFRYKNAILARSTSELGNNDIWYDVDKQLYYNEIAVTTGITNHVVWTGYLIILYPTERTRVAFGNPHPF